MGRRNAVIYVAATLAALGCLYGCGNVPYGASETNAVGHANAASDDQSAAPAGSQAAATAAARQVLSRLVVPAGSKQLPQRPTPAGLSAPAQTLGATSSVDVYRLYQLRTPAGAAAAYLRSHLPAGLVAEGTGQVRAAWTAAATPFVIATPERLPAGIYALELVDTIAPAGSGSSWLRADVQVIWYPARSGAENRMPTSYRSVRVSRAGWGGPAITTTSRSVIGTVEALLKELPAAPAVMRSCPAITVVYDLTLEPAHGGQPAVVISTGGCDVDSVSVGSRQQPALWDQGDRMFRLARSLLEPLVPWVSPPLKSECKIPKMQATHGSVPCAAKPTLAPRIPN